jgi:hypothetical protein
MPSYSPLFGGNYAPTVDRNSMERVVTRLMKKLGKRQRIMVALNGTAVGGATATSSRKQVQHSTTELGGRRTIQTYYDVNRTTTAADKTANDALLFKSTRINTPTARPSYWNNL